MNYGWNSHGCDAGTSEENYLEVIARRRQVFPGVPLFESF
jgi:hypothetical protein